MIAPVKFMAGACPR